MIHLPEILKVLEAAPLFRGIPSKTLSHHLGESKFRTLNSGEMLLSAGQVNDVVYIVLSGRLSVQLKEANVESIAMLGEGECVGEMSILGDAPVSAYVIAATSCKLLAIDRDAILNLIDSSLEAAHNMLSILTKRIRLADQLMAENLEKQQGFSGISIVDEMTGLYNRSWTREKFDRHLQRSAINNKHSCVLMVEMDKFQAFNRDYGRLGGDQALRDIANVMLTCLRPDDQAGHYSDQRFVVYLPNTGLSDACTAAVRLRATANRTLVVLPSGDALPAISISIGVGQARFGESLDELFARAEEALQLAQKAGGNCVKSVP